MQSGLQNKDREALQSMYEQLKSRTKTDRQQEQSLKQTERMLAQDRYWDTYASEGQVQGLAQELQNFAEENAEILFGDVREMKDDTVARYASEEQKAQLQTLRARRDELKGKERKKMNRRIYDVNRQVQTELHERLDKELDEDGRHDDARRRGKYGADPVPGDAPENAAERQRGLRRAR